MTTRQLKKAGKKRAAPVAPSLDRKKQRADLLELRRNRRKAASAEKTRYAASKQAGEWQDAVLAVDKALPDVPVIGVEFTLRISSTDFPGGLDIQNILRDLSAKGTAVMTDYQTFHSRDMTEEEAAKAAEDAKALEEYSKAQRQEESPSRKDSMELRDEHTCHSCDEDFSVCVCDEDFDDI